MCVCVCVCVVCVDRWWGAGREAGREGERECVKRAYRPMMGKPVPAGMTKLVRPLAQPHSTGPAWFCAHLPQTQETDVVARIHARTCTIHTLTSVSAAAALFEWGQSSRWTATAIITGNTHIIKANAHMPDFPSTLK